MRPSRDPFAIAAGAIRGASGVSFLIDPLRAGRLWGADTAPSPRAALLLRSMGYRDALIGALLFKAGLDGRNVAGWFLGSAGADAADLMGGLANHRGLDDRERTIGLWGAAAGIVIGAAGAVHATRSSASADHDNRS